jgi:hypothetical protein
MVYLVSFEKTTRPPPLHDLIASIIAPESSEPPPFTTHSLSRGDDAGIGLNGGFGPILTWYWGCIAWRTTTFGTFSSDSGVMLLSDRAAIVLTHKDRRSDCNILSMLFDGR